MVTLPRTQSASPGGERPGTGQLRVAHHLRETDGPGPRAPPSPSRSTLPCGDLGPPPGPAHQTPEKDPVLRWLGQPLHPRASRLPLVHASEDVWGWPAHSPLWTAGVREGVARNPVDWGAGAGVWWSRGLVGTGSCRWCRRANSPAAGRGALVEGWGSQLPHPHLRSSEPCPAASALPAGLGGLGVEARRGGQAV